MDSSSHHPRQSQESLVKSPALSPWSLDRESVGSMLYHTWVATLQSQFGLAMMALAFWGLALVESLALLMHFQNPYFGMTQQYNIKIKISLFLYIVDCLLGSCHVLIQPIRPRSAMTFVAGQHRDNSCSQSSDSQRRGAEQSKEG